MLINFYTRASLPFLCPLLLLVSKISHHPKCFSSPSCNWTQNVSLLLVPLPHCGFWWFGGPIGFLVVCALVDMGMWWFDLIFSIYSSWVRLSGWWWLVFFFFLLFLASGGDAIVGLSLSFGFGFVICLWFWWLGVKVVGGGDNGYGGGWVIGCWVGFMASGLWLVVGGVFFFFLFFLLMVVASRERRDQSAWWVNSAL